VIESNIPHTKWSYYVIKLPLRLRAAIGASLVASLAACGQSSAPSDQEIVSKVAAYVATTSDVWDVKNVHKTNGTRKDDGTYVADVAYDAVFRASFDDTYKREQKEHGDLVAMQIMQPLMQQYGMWPRGKTAHLEGSYPFVKSEKGWIISTD
jgi:hypothetical protein